MDILGAIFPVIGVIAAILVLVIAHELGHFIAAKMCGMRVHEFAVGFGSRKWTVFNKGGTEYTIRPIPAGGFVRIAGMDPGEEDPPADGFNSKSVWARMWVIFAGPLASFLFAYLVFCSLGMTLGLPEPRPLIQSVQIGSPAEKIGLKAGDRFLEIDGKKITTGDEMMAAIRSNPGKKIKVVVSRGEQTLVFYPTVRADNEGGQLIGRLGFTPGSERVRLGFVQSISSGTKTSIDFVKGLVGVIFSKRITKEAGGPIAIIYSTHEMAKNGIAALLTWTAMLSLNFAVLNLLPIPVLDGGHLLILFVEVIRRKPLSARAQHSALMAGFATLILIAVLVIFKDISNLSRLAR